jgi:hypothetical protein
MNYSGSTKFDYMIYRDLPNGITNTYEEEIILKIEGRSYFAHGKYSGAWEDSYPDEGDTEILSVIGPDGKDWEDQLSDIQKAQILDIIQEKVSTDEDYDPPDIDYYDRDYHDDFGTWESDYDY